jgi:hypothetical protein
MGHTKWSSRLPKAPQTQVYKVARTCLLLLLQGTCYTTPLLGALLADSRWGRYKTILIFSMIYLLVRALCVRRLHDATSAALAPRPSLACVTLQGIVLLTLSSALGNLDVEQEDPLQFGCAAAIENPPPEPPPSLLPVMCWGR